MEGVHVHLERIGRDVVAMRVLVRLIYFTLSVLVGIIAAMAVLLIMKFGL